MNRNFSYGYYEHVPRWNYFKGIYDYVGGDSSDFVARNETIIFEQRWTPSFSIEGCQATVNGGKCDTCFPRICPDNFGGYQVNCENLDGVGSMALCDGNPEDDGPLTVFSLQDPSFRRG